MRFLLIPFLTLAVSAQAATYKIDSSHSTVGFKVRHLAISSVPGKFGEFEGTFDFDPTKIEASKTDAKIKLASIDTTDKKRDEHLKGDDFFAVAKYPEMKFVSKEVTDVNGSTFKVTGDLTLHGVTKPVTLDVEYAGMATDPWGNERAGFSATTKIHRKDFGLAWSKVLETGALVVGDEVTVNLEIEGVKAKA